MSPYQVPEGPYTIEFIMESIRTQIIDSEGSAGESAPEGGNGAAAQALVSDGSARSRLIAQIELMRQRQGLDPGYRIQSHRPLVGRVFNLIKRVIHWGSRPYTDAVRGRQEAFNDATLQALREISLQLDDLERGRQQSLKKLDLLLDRLQEVLENIVGRRIDSLEREQAEIREALKDAAGEMRGGLTNLQKSQEDGRAVQQQTRIDLERRCQELLLRAQELEYKRQLLVRQDVDKIRFSQLDLKREFQSLVEPIIEEVGRYDMASFFEPVSDEQRLAMFDQTRGSFEDISDRLSIYIEMFKNAPGPVVDVGCGRGELLDMLLGRDIECWGVESDPVMVRFCRQRGVQVIQSDALSALRAAAPATLGGIFAAQVIEHLFPGELLAFLRLAGERLTPGGLLVIESLNPSVLGVLAKSYYRDIDHKQPVHPQYLKLLLELAGFEQVNLGFLSPFKDDERLPDLLPAGELGLSDAAHDAIQIHIDRLNALLFGMQDYYVVGRRQLKITNDKL
jgi:SAM-dependent methyltransferase